MAQEFEQECVSHYQDTRVLPQTDRSASPYNEALEFELPSSLQSPSSPPISLMPTLISLPQPEDPSVNPHHQEETNPLAIYGIKVRDFAYESKLPPIRTVRFLPRQIQPRQIQPGPRPLKRMRRDGDSGDDPFLQSQEIGSGEGESSRKSKLERRVTEPALQPLPPTRARGFTNLEEYSPSLDSQFLTSNSQQTGWATPSNSQPPPQFFDSQESEPYIDTPVVTPNGSLQWPVLDNSDVPASQLDTASQAIVPEPVSYSQLGFSHADKSSQQVTASTPSTPLSSLSELPLPPIPLTHGSFPGLSSEHPKHRSSLLFLAASNPGTSNLYPGPNEPTPAPITTPRYHLRKRPVADSPSPSPTRPVTRARRIAQPLTHLASRPLAYSRQSSHARTKIQSSTSSPRSRTLRKPGGSNGETMVVK